MMNMRKKICVVAAALFLAASPFASAQSKNFNLAKWVEVYNSILKELNRSYVDSLEVGRIQRTAIDAMLSSLDPYTQYVPEEEQENFQMMLTNTYGGIGAIIYKPDVNGNVIINEPYEGSPAARNGIRCGDEVEAIDGVSTHGLTSQESSDRMRGKPGTTVVLTVKKLRGQTVDIPVVRERISLPSVEYVGMLNENDGYILLEKFTEGVGQDIRDAYHKLKDQGMKRLVLDLRGNGGGLMNEAVDIVNIWVPRGTLVVETKGKVASKNMKSFTRMNPEDTEIPLAVIIDGNSASASEIVSGSLQDLDRAVVIGQRSYGKGLVQNILPMPYNSQMKVTVSKYYIPSGRCIQAIDYSHRDENGRALKVPDSLKTAFKTKSGRTVYDGFGIEPDVEVEPEYMSNLGIALAQKLLVFDYATLFYRSHKSIPPAAEFEITDDIYNDFCHFLKEKNLSYSTVTERMIEQLTEIAKQEKYDKALEQQISDMKAKLKAEKEDDLQKHKDEVKEMLKGEILNRYYYDKGRLQGALKEDKVLNRAIEELTSKK